MDLAHSISLIGNRVTLSTFPERFRKKMHIVTVSGSRTYIKNEGSLLPDKREFLWFNGYGAITRG